jgi:hypothetical protein
MLLGWQALLAPDLLVSAEPYLSGKVAEPPQGGPCRFVYNDICPDHLLSDPATGRLAALIDFADAMAARLCWTSAAGSASPGTGSSGGLPGATSFRSVRASTPSCPRGQPGFR